MASKDPEAIKGISGGKPRPQAALTAANGGTINSGDATTDAVIGNNRTRIAELEAILEAHGMLPES